jgi:hypothetical protein
MVVDTGADHRLDFFIAGLLLIGFIHELQLVFSFEDTSLKPTFSGWIPKASSSVISIIAGKT